MQTLAEKFSAEFNRAIKEHEVELQVAQAKIRASDAAFRLLQKEMKKLREKALEADFLQEKNRELTDMVAESTRARRASMVLSSTTGLTPARPLPSASVNRRSLGPLETTLSSHPAAPHAESGQADEPASPTKEDQRVTLRRRLSSLSTKPRSPIKSVSEEHHLPARKLEFGGQGSAVGYDMLRAELEDTRAQAVAQQSELQAQHEAEIQALQAAHNEALEHLQAKHRLATSDAILDAECAIVQALATQRQLEEQVLLVLSDATPLSPQTQVTLNTRLEQQVRMLLEQLKEQVAQPKPSLFGFRRSIKAPVKAVVTGRKGSTVDAAPESKVLSLFCSSCVTPPGSSSDCASSSGSCAQLLRFQYQLEV